MKGISLLFYCKGNNLTIIQQTVLFKRFKNIESKRIIFMRKLLFLLAFLPIAAQAQWQVGIEGGVSFNYLQSNYDASNSAQVGAKASALISYTTEYYLYFESGLSYIGNKGGKIYEFDIQHQALSSIDTKIQDLRIPISIGYVIYITDEWAFVPKFGGWFGLGIAGRTHIDAKDEKGNHYKESISAFDSYEYVFDKTNYYLNGFHKFDAGVSLGIDFRYTNVIIRAKCDLGLRNLNSSLGNPQSRSYSVVLGYFF